MADDTSARPHELLGLKIRYKILTADDGKLYTEIHISDGKTGLRTIPIIDSLPYLKDWIEEHNFL